MFNNSPTARLDTWLYKICMVIARLVLAYLFFTQLFWKLPPSFGCRDNYAFPKPAEQNYFDSNNSSGLCYWMGLESIYASQPHRVLIADMRSAGWADFGVDISPLSKLNGVLLDNLFIPYIQVFGWLVFLAELWVFISMTLGLFTRLGGLAALGISLQLYIGLANVPRPFEWEWTYGVIVGLSIAMLGAAAGRTLGLDGWLRGKLTGPAERGNRLAKFVLLLG